jgi:hypothetical protein
MTTAKEIIENLKSCGSTDTKAMIEALCDGAYLTEAGYTDEDQEAIEEAVEILKNENKMRLYRNENPSFGESGPFEAESKEKLADEMMATFRDWAMQAVTAGTLAFSQIHEDIDTRRKEFIAGLVEVG